MPSILRNSTDMDTISEHVDPSNTSLIASLSTLALVIVALSLAGMYLLWQLHALQGQIRVRKDLHGAAARERDQKAAEVDKLQELLASFARSMNRDKGLLGEGDTGMQPPRLADHLYMSGAPPLNSVHQEGRVPNVVGQPYDTASDEHGLAKRPASIIDVALVRSLTTSLPICAQRGPESQVHQAKPPPVGVLSTSPKNSLELETLKASSGNGIRTHGHRSLMAELEEADIDGTENDDNKIGKCWDPVGPPAWATISLSSPGKKR
ncbi:hypothetical protein VTK73DRAFT_6808 [Phialemonium thermophilum]|uniref:Uncharacterized protein n=1 Tax=Phialemonium thermophilum TaxID=223376 RepID=A0ABR3Y779_9PEZI